MASLSPRLSPKAKKLVLKPPATPVAASLECARAADIPAIRAAIEACGGQVRHASGDMALVTFEIAAEHLPTIADLNGVIQVSAGEKYRE